MTGSDRRPVVVTVVDRAVLGLLPAALAAVELCGHVCPVCGGCEACCTSDEEGHHDDGAH